MASIEAAPPGSDPLQKSSNIVLSHLLDAPHTFLKPSTGLYSASVLAAKGFLEPLAAYSIETHTLPHEGATRKRKRRNDNADRRGHEVPLRRLYVDGFGVEQVWGQATRIIDTTVKHLEHNIFHQAPHDHSRTEIESFDDVDSDSVSAVSGSDGLEGSGSIGNSSEEASAELQGDEDLDEDGGSDDEHMLESHDELSDVENPNREVYKEDPFGLNDGFFSIDDFNKQSQFFESQDARGDNDDDYSDDEAIDWHADPQSQGEIPSKSKSLGISTLEHDGSAVDEEGDLSLTVPDGDDDSDIDLMGNSFIDTNDIKYADFFAPPPRKASGQRFRPLPKTQPEEANLDTELNRAMADVHRDLFDDDASHDGSEVSSSRKIEDSSNGYSTHEKRQAQIANEIRRLEAENVAKKEWMLAGEARAVERPLNSLIEEDLEFERTGKPVPVVTNETSEEIEALVKRRIVAKEFDEIIRRLPTSLTSKSFKGEKFELDDSKPQQSLAELYEADHLHNLDPNRLSQKDQRLQEQHQTILELWREISSQLDSLSNWHYKPKIPSASINVVTDVATVTMEDARPTASNAVADGGMLAPQEIYNPVEETARGGEVVLKSGASLAKDEMSREEKLRMRRRAKERVKKSKPQTAVSRSRKATEKADLLAQLRRGGVKVVGEKGQLRDVNGGRIKEGPPEQGGRLKL